jgi:hypothetical protein
MEGSVRPDTGVSSVAGLQQAHRPSLKYLKNALYTTAAVARDVRPARSVGPDTVVGSADS